MIDRFSRQGRPWTVLEYALFVLIAEIGFWTVWSELSDIVRIALRDDEQSHILLVPVIAGWLLLLRRGRLKFVRFNPSPLGLVMLFGAWMMIWSGYETDTIVLQHTGALIFLLGGVVTVTGTIVVRQFLPVIVVFAFFIPVPGTVRQVITMPLQRMAASITQGVLEFVGVASEQAGSSLIVNGTHVAVGEACNGMRMVFALTLIVYAFVFSVPIRHSTKRMLLFVSPLVALVCNVIRLVPTALVYGYGSIDHAEQFHDLAGWIMLPIALAILVGSLRLMNWLEVPVRQWRLAH